MAKRLAYHNANAWELYHSGEEVSPGRSRYITLDLYPALPPDVGDWCDSVYMTEDAKETFLTDIGPDEYCVTLLVDRKTGDYHLAEVAFFPDKKAVAL